jgi:hypothetical protein
MVPSGESLQVAAEWTQRSVLPNAEWIRNTPGIEIVKEGPLPIPGSKIG